MSLPTLGRELGDFIEQAGLPLLALGLVIIIGLRGAVWIIGSLANG